MRYTPAPFSNRALMPHVSFRSSAYSRIIAGAAVASAVWPSANMAIFMPFRAESRLVARRMWLAVGATGGTDSVDMGIYDTAGKRIVSSGGAVVGTANQVQHLDITDTTLQPGDYYIGIAYNGVTATILMQSQTFIASARLVGLVQMAAAYVLPATATFAQFGTAGSIPVCGIATTATP